MKISCLYNTIGKNTYLLSGSIGLWILLFSCGLLIPHTAQADDIIIGSRNIVSESRTVSSFDKIVMKGGAGEIYITQGDKESLKIEAEDNIISLIDAHVEANTLVLGFKHVSFQPNQKIKYYLQVKNLQGIQSYGAAKISAKGNFKTEEFNLEIRGAETVKLHDLDVNTLTVQMSGNSSIEAAGKAKDQNINITGAGVFQGKDLQGKTGNVHLGGSAFAKVNVSESLDIKIYGAGEVKYYGKPKITQSVTGAGKIVSED